MGQRAAWCVVTIHTPCAHSAATSRDEPGSGGVRVGQTRSDLDCRVVATSRRVAPTECDSRLPLFGRGSTCRLRLLDSWSPARAEAVVFRARRAARLVCRDLSPRQSPARQTYVAREGWPNSSDSSDSVGLCRTKMSRHTRLVRHAPARKSARLGPKCEESDESTSRADFRGGGASDESGRGGATPRDF